MELELTTKKEDNALTVALNGELNTQTAPLLKTILDENVDKIDALYLDFAGCDFVSSAGLRVLVRTYKVIKAKNGVMKLLNIGPSFSEVLNITGLDVVFNIKR